MPDLGKYAFEVALAYGGAFVLLALLVAFVWSRSHRVKTRLRALEAARENRAEND